jgi:uncharacterized protein (UPF0548 family)
LKQGAAPFENAMFLLREPTSQQIREFLESAPALPLSYAEVEATRGKAPAGYKIDHNRVMLGTGAAAFQLAITAMKGWKHFDLGWAKLSPENAPIVAGSVVAILVNHFALWSLNACRIVYVVDEQDGPIKKFGFAYGTLSEHAERGEERFMIEWNEADNTVSYDILAYSQPNHWLAKVGYPITRWWQKRFARDSLKSMLKHAGQGDEKRLTVSPL